MPHHDQLNLKILSNPHSKKFISELKHTVKNIHSKQVRTLFGIILKHFREEISNDTGKAILSSIKKLIEKPKILEIFIKYDYYLLLPFQISSFTDPLFDLLLSLVELAPELFDEEVSAQFSLLIPRNPSKSLTILAFYGLRFDDIKNPWPFLDLLFKNSSAFCSGNISIDYISLLVYLCRSYPVFRDERAVYSWNYIARFLRSNDIHTVKTVYNGLTAITDVLLDNSSKFNLSLPNKLLYEHLSSNHLQKAALHLLMLAPIHSISEKNLRKLLSIASSEKQATLALINLASIYDTSAILLQIHGWINTPLPTFLDTFRIFLSVFRHKDLRDSFLQIRGFVSFLNKVLQTAAQQPRVIPTLCTVIRRLDLNEEFVNYLGETGFFAEFFDVAFNGDDIDKHSGLLMADRIGQKYSPKGMNKACDSITEIIKEDKKLSCIAAEVAINLLRDEKCAKRFIRNKLKSFFRKCEPKSKLGKLGKQFNKLIQDEFDA